MPITYNEDKLPYVKATVTGIVTSAELSGFLSKLKSLFDRQLSFSLICNVRHMKGSLLDYGTAQVYVLSDWMKKCDKETKLYMKNTIIIMDSPFIKFMLETVVFKIKPPNSTFHFCKDTKQVRQLLTKS